VQDGWDYVRKILRLIGRGYAVHVRVNGETKKGFLLALTALVLARSLWTASAADLLWRTSTELFSCASNIFASPGLCLTVSDPGAYLL
jgi:hypothetical protein